MLADSLVDSFPRNEAVFPPLFPLLYYAFLSFSPSSRMFLFAFSVFSSPLNSQVTKGSCEHCLVGLGSLEAKRLCCSRIYEDHVTNGDGSAPWTLSGYVTGLPIAIG